MTLRVLGLLLPAGAVTGIFFLSALPGGSFPEGPSIPHADKVVHAILYALLLSSFRFWRGVRRPGWEWIPGGIVASLIAAVADEWHQGAVPGRSPEFFDWVADGVGIGLASLVWARWPRLLRHRRLR